MRKQKLIYSGLALILPLLLVGCGAAGGSSAVNGGSVRILTTSEAKHLLLELPYRYKFRPVALPRGASGALAGTAIGRHHTVLHFGLALGQEPYPVPVPRSGTEEAYGYGGFVYTDDLEVPGKHGKWEPGPQYKTNAQWNEAGHMEVQMEEKLCRAETGEPCHEG